MPILTDILNFVGDKLPWTPVGRGILAAREQAQMSQYRQQMMQRQTQQWDTEQQQQQAAKAMFRPGAPHPEQIPVTPTVGSPGYDQARQQLDQTQIGTAAPVDYLKGPQSAVAQGLAGAGLFTQAGNVLEQNIPKPTEWHDETASGLLGQRNTQTGKFDPFPQKTTAAGKDAIRMMTPQELEQWGFPKGTVAAMNTVTGEPEVKFRPDLRESAELQARTQQGPAFILPDGGVVAGEFTPNGGYGYRKGGKLVPLPDGARPTTPSTGGMLTPKAFLELRNNFTQEQQALNRLNKYGESVGGMNTGIKNWADSVTAKFRTMLGSKELNPAEFARMTAEGQLQALLGLFRTDVVGPGVLTEFDARRVLDALGGNVGMLQNPQVVQKLLSDLYADKMQRVKLLESEIARNSPAFGTQPMTITAPEQFTGTGAPEAPNAGASGALSPEEQRELEQLRRELGGK